MSSLPASIKKIESKQPRKGGDIIFPIISRWGLSVAMETRVMLVCVEVLRPSQPNGVMSSRSVYLIIFLMGRLSHLSC